MTKKKAPEPKKSWDWREKAEPPELPPEERLMAEELEKLSGVHVEPVIAEPTVIVNQAELDALMAGGREVSQHPVIAEYNARAAAGVGWVCPTCGNTMLNTAVCGVDGTRLAPG